jgi:hypothetical protein
MEIVKDVEKTIKVINSCTTSDQLTGALNMVNNLNEKHLLSRYFIEDLKETIFAKKVKVSINGKIN